MATFFVTTTASGQRGNIWIAFQVDDVDTIPELFRRLRDDRVVLGKRAIFAPRDRENDNGREVIGREDYILGVEAIATIRAPSFPATGPHGWTLNSEK